MKKAISFVLVLALVLGSFSMAFAGTVTDVAGDDNEVAIKVVNDLGIVTGYGDGTFQADKAVNRAEFAAMIVRALNIPDSALAGYTTTTFKDTTGYGWAVKYLAFCEDKGIMLGDGNGNVMPGRTINMNEAVTMILRALGITDNSAWLVGSWPANYVTLAKTYALYDDVDAVTTVDRGTAAQLIYNALSVATFTVNANGDTEQGLVTLIEDLATADVTKGAVTYESDSLIPLAEYIGAYGTTYRSDNKIVAVDVESVFLTGEFEDADTFVTTDDVTYTVTGTTNAAAYIVNGIQAGGTATTAGSASLGEVTIAVEISGKKITNLYSIVDWNVSKAFKATESQLKTLASKDTLDTYVFVMDDNDEIKDASFQLFGAKTLADIEKDDIVYIYAATVDGTAKTIIKIEVGTETVEGKITKVTSSDEYVINGDKYVTAAAFSGSLEAGDEGTFYLDYAGDIYGWDETSSLVGNYAVVIATDTTTSYGIATDSVRIFTKEGFVQDYVLDGITKSALTTGLIIDYALNSDGEIDTVDFVSNTAVTGASVEADLINTTKVSSNVVVFLYEGIVTTGGSFDKAKFEIGTMADLKETTDGTEALIYVVDDEEIVAILAGTSNQGNADDSYGIITNFVADGTLDADGEKVNYADIILEDAVKEEVESDATLSAAGTTNAALYAITINEKGVITTVAAVSASQSAVTITEVDGNLVTVSGGAVYKLASDVIVYLYDTDLEEWVVGAVTDLEDMVVNIYETDKDTAGFEYVVAWDAE